MEKAYIDTVRVNVPVSLGRKERVWPFDAITLLKKFGERHLRRQRTDGYANFFVIYRRGFF